MNKLLLKQLSLLLISFSFCTVAAFGQHKSRADRYIDAYKQYVNASCPFEKDSIQHFVYFARDREKIHHHIFLEVPRIAGAQIMYAWRELEPERGKYDFSIIMEDYNFLRSHGKKLFIQLQDVTFDKHALPCPDYLRTDEFGGGETFQYGDSGAPEGHVTKRWNANVQKRFALLMNALGQAFDGKVEGINLQESSIGIKSKENPDYTQELYRESIKKNMLALKKAFPASTTMQYANFMPGEWLPGDDKGYLRSIYAYGDSIGVGLGGPDLMVKRKGQLNHTIAMMHEHHYIVPLGIAIQDGNYTEQTGADADYNESTAAGSPGHKNIVPMLHAFAKDFMRVNYMFWSAQEPFFSEDVIPCLNDN